jgi:hypothetical protein
MKPKRQNIVGRPRRRLAAPVFANFVATIGVEGHEVVGHPIAASGHYRDAGLLVLK